MDGVQDINLNFDTSEADHALSKFSKNLIKTLETVKVNPLKQLDEDIEKTEKNIKELSDKLEQAMGQKTPIRLDIDKEAIKEQKVLIKELGAEITSAEKALSKMSPGRAYEKEAASLQRMKNDLVIYKDELQEMQQPQYRYVNAEDTSEFKELTAEIKTQEQNLILLNKAREDLAKNSNKINISSKLSLKNILKYAIGIRSLYALFSRLKSAAKQGLDSIANYSPALKKSIDNINSAFNQMKSAVGAAVAPLVQSLEPVIARIAQLFTIAANAVARFFAALTGKNSVVQATKNQAAFNKQVGESNKQLAKFDDLNVLDNDGGGGAGADVSGQFEEIDLSDNKDFFTWLGNWIRENLPFILAIASAFALWKIADSLITNAETLSRIFPFISDYIGPISDFLKNLAGWILIIAGSLEYFLGFFDALANGVTWDNLTQMILGAAAAFIGLWIVFGIGAAAIGLLVAGIGLVISGFVDWINTGELSTEAMAAICIGILAIGGAIALLTGAWIPLVIAAVGALAIFVINKWEDIKKVLSKVWDWIKTSVINPIISGINGFLSAAVKGINALIDALNTLSFDIPDWVPMLGGKHFGLDINHISTPEIPLLAKGAVLPPNQPFLAMLGDQKSGTNIEAPLDTIVEAMQQALSNMNYTGNQEIVMNIDGTTLARLTVPNTLDELNRRGYNVKVLEGK